MPESTSTMLYRKAHHCSYDVGEARAILQLLGHPDLPQFVGNTSQAVYHAGGDGGMVLAATDNKEVKDV